MGFGAAVARAAEVPALWKYVDPCPRDVLTRQTDRCWVVAANVGLLGARWLTLDLFGDRVKARRVRRYRDFGSAWSGRIQGDDFSNATFAAVQGSVAGVLTLSSGRSYRLRDTGTGKTILELLKTSEFVLHERPVFAKSRDFRKENTDAAAAARCESRSAASEVGILVPYTSRAAKWAGGVDGLHAWVEVAEARTNWSLQQSGVPDRIRLVGVRWVPFEETTSAGGDLLELEDKTTDLGRLVHQWRDHDDKADLVVLVSSHEAGNGESRGLYNLKGDPDSSSFAVVSIEGFAGIEGFSHEIGHMLGAGHVEEDQHGLFPSSRAVRETYESIEPKPTKCGCWSTIMDGASICVHLPYWSAGESASKLCGRRMGSDVADNTETIGKTACIVAGYR